MRLSSQIQAEGLAGVARRVRAYVGLGSNVGDPRRTLERAVAAMAALPGVRLRRVSRLYATAPVGVRDQPDFLNAAVSLDVPAGPDPERGALALLGLLKALERQAGRRPRARWGPRELDLDLLLFGHATVEVERPTELGGDLAPAEARRDGRPPEPRLLQVPHRDVHERLFVLAPLADLAPRLRPPGWRETVEAVRRAREAVEGALAVRAIADWDPESGRWTRETTP